MRDPLAAVVGPIVPTDIHAGGIAFTVCTYYGGQCAEPQHREKPEYDGSEKNPINIYLDAGLRIVLGEPAGRVDVQKPSLLIERQADRWIVMLHPDAGDMLVMAVFPDDGPAYVESDGPEPKRIQRPFEEPLQNEDAAADLVPGPAPRIANTTNRKKGVTP